MIPHQAEREAAPFAPLANAGENPEELSALIAALEDRLKGVAPASRTRVDPILGAGEASEPGTDQGSGAGPRPPNVAMEGLGRARL